MTKSMQTWLLRIVIAGVIADGAYLATVTARGCVSVADMGTSR
jgi:hypothetical protein